MIGKMCTAFNNDLYSIERFALHSVFVLRWMIGTALSDLCYVEWFVLGWMICTALSDLYYV